MTAYYNENDPYAAEWLRNLIKSGLIANGEVDERSITDVKAKDLVGFTQCHFFAGIGGWSYALRLARWPDDRPVWTGSCPCQPFSCAGKGRGTKDERHLWPVWRRLICDYRRETGAFPPTIFGEQVASKAGCNWYAGVRSNQERLGYETGCADLCAAGAGAPHIRQRLFWLANPTSDRLKRKASTATPQEGLQPGSKQKRELSSRSERHTVHSRRLADSGLLGPQKPEEQTERRKQYSQRNSLCSGVANSNSTGQCTSCRAVRTQGGNYSRGCCEACGMGNSINKGSERREEKNGYGTTSNFWSDFDVVYCRDEKFRRIESGAFPLAHGIPRSVGKGKPKLRELAKSARANRKGQLRGYGNAIVPQIAAEFIKAFMGAI